jgi:hypothetical protein
MLRSHGRAFCIGLASVVVGFGVGWAALVSTTASPLPARPSSGVTETAGAPETARAEPTQPPAAAPGSDHAVPERTAEAPRAASPAPAPAPAPVGKAAKKRTELRFDADDGKSSASFDPDTRRLRVRLPFGEFNLDM